MLSSLYRNLRSADDTGKGRLSTPRSVEDQMKALTIPGELE